MREYTEPGAIEIAPDDNAIAALWDWERRAPDKVALAYRDGDRFVGVTTSEFAQQARELAAGFVGLGIEPGSRICIFSETRIEFTYLDYAIWAAGCVTVTIYESSSAEQVEWIVGNSDAVAVVCANTDLKARFEEIADRVPECKHVFVIDGDGGLDELKAHGESVPAADVAARSAALTHDDLATLVYTSGTTGRPKGCALTHGNFIFEVRQVVTGVKELFHESGATLMFLPLAHVLARVVQVGCVTAGVKIGYSTGIPQLMEELEMFPPTWVFAVPRVFEKIFNTAQQKAGSGLKGWIFKHAVSTAIQYSEERMAGNVGGGTKFRHGIFERLVYSKLRDAFGGDLEAAVSGGAPLGTRLGHFFDGAGVAIYEGYGLTETSAAATINRPEEWKIGTVGRPVPGVSVGIADDGEVMIKGGVIFQGYWKNEEATADVFEDDWFASGDIGELDDDGYLRITGRKKDLIVTAGGKNVAPAVLEDRIRANVLVSECMVVGDAQPFIAVLITLDPDELPNWAERNGKSGTTAAELRDDPDLQAAVQAAIDEGNKAVSKAESVRTYRILDADFTIEGGELTPSLKVKRNVVLEKYSDVLDSIYG